MDGELTKSRIISALQDALRNVPSGTIANQAGEDIKSQILQADMIELGAYENSETQSGSIEEIAEGAEIHQKVICWRLKGEAFRVDDYPADEED